MGGNGIVVEFPSGRRLRRQPPDGNGSIACLVRSLSEGRARRLDASLIARPLSLRLDRLTGLNDETVAGLACLAARGVINPASAARLALRHAIESKSVRNDCRSARGGALQHPTLAMTLAGDVFGDFAFHLSLGKAWLGFASATCLASLLEICPADRGSVCMLVGCDAARRNTVRILTPRDWRRCLTVRHNARGESAHHLLVLGGLPSTGAARSAILIDLRNAVLSSGNNDLLEAGRRNHKPCARPHIPTRLGRDLLTLVELAMPGLVESIGNDREYVR